MQPKSKIGKIITTGFTIVELLIVIVVIGILASITILAYNGIQKRAIDTRRVSAIDAVEKALHIYKAQHGTFPIDWVTSVDFNTTSPLTCIGEMSDYPARDGFKAGECAYVIESGSRSTYAQIIPALNETLRNTMGVNSMPNGSYPPFGAEEGGSGMFVRGVLLHSAIDDGDTMEIAYYDRGVESGNSCGRGIREQFDFGNGQTAVLCLLETQ